jgi:hypothetical protein
VPNRKERDQAQRVLETRQPTGIDTDKDRNWKVVGRKSSTPLRKAAMRGAVERNEGYDKVAGTVCDKGLVPTGHALVLQIWSKNMESIN